MPYGDVAATVNPPSDIPSVEISSPNNDKSSHSITQSLQGLLPMRFKKR